MYNIYEYEYPLDLETYRETCRKYTHAVNYVEKNRLARVGFVVKSSRRNYCNQGEKMKTLCYQRSVDIIYIHSERSN